MFPERTEKGRILNKFWSFYFSSINVWKNWTFLQIFGLKWLKTILPILIKIEREKKFYEEARVGKTATVVCLGSSVCTQANSLPRD
jgi:hypothetical protein